MKQTHILKHKDIRVASVSIENGDVYDLKILEKDHLPFLMADSDQKNIMLMNKWIEHRGIPFSREDYDEIMRRYNVGSGKELTILGHGLNLTDHWWLCESNVDKQWRDVNYLDNKFSQRVGELLPDLHEKYMEYLNPDLSSNGHLKKMWAMGNDGSRVLCKAGSGDIRQEPYNEYIASIIAQKLGIDHVEYTLGYDEKKDEMYSMCNCMIDRNLEFIDSFHVFLHGNNTNDRYADYIRTCEEHGMPEARKEVDKMILLDYLIRNTDRNNGNYGVLRNSETLQWEKIAPVFDNGGSLWHNVSIINNIGKDKRSNCRSFEGENEKNIKRVGSVDWYNGEKMKGMPERIKDILSKNRVMEKERVEAIGNAFGNRLRMLDNELNRNVEQVNMSAARTIKRSY